MKDAVGRLTPLGLMLLALLREDDMHPYEMMRLMRQRHDDRLVTITNGTVYHTVARLLRQGMLAEVGVDRHGNRPERTTYTLTDAGREAVPEWVRRELPVIDRPAEFRVALAEAHNIARDEVVALLMERRAALAASDSYHRSGREKALEKAVPEQYLLEIEREHVLAEAELHWLDGLIARLERHDFEWGPTTGPHSDRYLAQREAARQ
ncbi:PadR family transcriptional regulator [Microbacterium fluvii]|uniref:PadR family transcriptional regulator n=1 Tax=Microbacterium fluvii TaxID=415215 RepID=A0ABW2HG21_9MICO|nr:PadR family transcriptional regulator [Microbacterium fluvii]MCU4673840.1 PadR family transcriptional regulator [Microbacterium fluvii]